MRLENAVLVPEILIRQLEKHIILTAMKVKQIDRVELKRRGFISSFSGSSGIIYSDGFVYIIADKSNVLSVFDVNDQTLKKEIALKRMDRWKLMWRKSTSRILRLSLVMAIGILSLVRDRQKTGLIWSYLMKGLISSNGYPSRIFIWQ